MFELVRQVGSFGIVGLLATGVHFIVFSILSGFEIDPIQSNVVAFCCAVPVSFYGNRSLTFKADGKVARFIVMSLIGLGMNHANVWLVTRYLELPWTLALPGMLLAVPAFSFIVSKFWVYRQG
ncbi:GtrA-like protein [compost metagenome]